MRTTSEVPSQGLKAPCFSAAGFRLSQLMALAKQIAAAQLQAPAHRQAETAAALTLPVLLLLSACATEPASPPAPRLTRPATHQHFPTSRLSVQNDEG